MSKCISQRGEYSEHEAGEGGWCVYCGDLDLAAHDADVVARVRGEVAAAIRRQAGAGNAFRDTVLERAARIAEGRES